MAEEPKDQVLVIGPADWENLKHRISRESSLRPAEAGTPNTLWGLPVVISNEMPAGKALMGDFGNVSRFDTRKRCECCGRAAEPSGCFGGGYPVCVCYLSSGMRGPELCQECELCAHHHNDLPFGACVKSDLSQRVIKVRAAERARRQGAVGGEV